MNIEQGIFNIEMPSPEGVIDKIGETAFNPFKIHHSLFNIQYSIPNFRDNPNPINSVSPQTH